MEITTRENYKVGVVHADPVFSHWQQLVDSLRAPTPAPDVLEKLLWRRERFNLLRHLVNSGHDARAAQDIKGIDIVCLGHTPLSGEAPWGIGNLLWMDNGCCAGYPLVMLDMDQWLTQYPPSRTQAAGNINP